MSSIETIIAIVVAFVGGSGLSTLLQVLFNRRKIIAETEKTNAEIDAMKSEASNEVLASFTGAAEKLVQASELGMEIYKRALDTATEHIDKLEVRVTSLEAVICEMKKEVDQRDVTIEALKKENSELRKELSKLEEAVICRDKLIADLRKRLSELETRLTEPKS